MLIYWLIFVRYVTKYSYIPIVDMQEPFLKLIICIRLTRYLTQSYHLIAFSNHHNGSNRCLTLKKVDS